MEELSPTTGGGLDGSLEDGNVTAVTQLLASTLAASRFLHPSAVWSNHASVLQIMLQWCKSVLHRDDITA